VVIATPSSAAAVNRLKSPNRPTSKIFIVIVLFGPVSGSVSVSGLQQLVRTAALPRHYGENPRD